MTEYVEVARAESERGEIVLRRRIEERAADALELRVNGVFVMDTRETTSEVELAAAALELVEHPRDAAERRQVEEHQLDQGGPDERY